MKTMIRIDYITESRAGPDLFARLRGACPQGETPYRTFDISCEESSPQAQAVLQLLKNAGWTPVGTSKTPGPMEFGLSRRRAYDEGDLRSAPFRWWFADDGCKNGGAIHNDPLFYVPRSELRKNDLVRRIQHFHPIVSEKFRELADHSGIRNCVYLETTPARYARVAEISKVQDWKDCPPPWWRLWSDTTLPPFSPSMIKTNWKGDPVPRECVERCGARDDLSFANVEFHFLRSEIEKIGPFDIALSAEWSSLPDTRWRFVSQRFYEFCIKHKIPSQWSPVRLDEG